MSTAVVSSRCECQGQLGAELDEHLAVRRGWARRPGLAEKPAPAHSIHPAAAVFQVGWACPHCGRNTLRSFSKSGLVWGG